MRWITRRRQISLFVGLWLILAMTGRDALGQETKTFVAFSMKVAQAQVQEAERRGEDFRRKRPDLFHLGGITKPWAVVADADRGDWIVVGERGPKASVLTLDDWVVALRARFVHVEADPGVTIDARPSAKCLKAGLRQACPDATDEDVRFFGGIENTHVGQVCFEADLLIKRIALAMEPVPVRELKTYLGLVMEQFRKAGIRRQVGSRFSFYPMVNRVNVFGDVVLLEKFQIGVFTEVLHAEADGKPVAGAAGLTDDPSEAFSRSFNEHYDAVAAARPILETLRGLTRLAALAKGLRQVDARMPLEYYLQSYPVALVATPKEKEIPTTTSQNVGVQLSGGVTIAALATRLKGGDASALKGLVLASRPSEAALTWEFAVGTRDGQVASVRLPAQVSDATEVASVFSRALFLHQKKHYDAAIDAYGKALTLAPDLVSAYVNRGQVYSRKGRYDLAIGDYDKAAALDATAANAYNGRGLAYQGKRDYPRAIADYDREISLHPRLADAYTNRGTAWSLSGDQDRAIADHDKAISLNLNFAAAYNNRGVALNLKKEHDRAIADFDKALSLDGGLAEPYVNRGVAFIERNAESQSAWRRALEDFDRSIALDPSNAHAYYWRGLARFEEYDHAMADLDKAIALDPGFARAGYYARAEVAEHAGRLKEAEEAYRKFLEVAPPGTPDVENAQRRLRELGTQR
jgi:tetratricopeptide (TPR) repeat protein